MAGKATYSPALTAQKGAIEGGSAAAVVGAITAMLGVDPELSLQISGAAGLAVAAFKALRNWYKHRKG